MLAAASPCDLLAVELDWGERKIARDGGREGGREGEMGKKRCYI